MITNVLEIFVSVLLPVLMIIGLGAVVHRFRPLELSTLVTLNFYLIVPAYLFTRISNSTTAWSEIARIGLVVFLPIAVVGVVVFSSLRWLQSSRDLIAASIVGTVFFNAGNFGIPVAELAFGETGGELQALVLMFLNFGTFMIAQTILAMGQGKSLLKSAFLFFKLPFPYIIFAAICVRVFSLQMPNWLANGISTTAKAMVPLALITLGAQLAQQARWPRWRFMVPIMLVKLLMMPLVTAAFVVLLGLWPWPGAGLILASAAPTAVNTLLLTMELGGDSETAADIVFWTTVTSSVTVAIILAILNAQGLPQFE